MDIAKCKRVRLSLKAKLLSNVKKQGKGENGCWIWQGALSTKGYGTFCFPKRGKSHRAHRVSYVLFVGDISEGALVCHVCDTPSCVNPKHLFLATAQQNTDDAIRKGRMKRGNQLPQAKLNETKIRNMRSLYQSGDYTHQAIAKSFDVSREMVGNIVRRKYWKHI